MPLTSECCVTHHYYLDTCFLHGAKALVLEMDFSDWLLAFKCHLQYLLVPHTTTDRWMRPTSSEDLLTIPSYIYARGWFTYCFWPWPPLVCCGNSIDWGAKFAMCASRVWDALTCSKVGGCSQIQDGSSRLRLGPLQYWDLFKMKISLKLRHLQIMIYLKLRLFKIETASKLGPLQNWDLFDNEASSK